MHDVPHVHLVMKEPQLLCLSDGHQRGGQLVGSSAATVGVLVLASAKMAPHRPPLLCRVATATAEGTPEAADALFLFGIIAF